MSVLALRSQLLKYFTNPLKAGEDACASNLFLFTEDDLDSTEMHAWRETLPQLEAIVALGLQTQFETAGWPCPGCLPDIASVLVKEQCQGPNPCWAYKLPEELVGITSQAASRGSTGAPGASASIAHQGAEDAPASMHQAGQLIGSTPDVEGVSSTSAVCAPDAERVSSTSAVCAPDAARASSTSAECAPHASLDALKQAQLQLILTPPGQQPAASDHSEVCLLTAEGASFLEAPPPITSSFHGMFATQLSMTDFRAILRIAHVNCSSRSLADAGDAVTSSVHLPCGLPLKWLTCVDTDHMDALSMKIHEEEHGTQPAKGAEMGPPACHASTPTSVEATGDEAGSSCVSDASRPAPAAHAPASSSHPAICQQSTQGHAAAGSSPAASTTSSEMPEPLVCSSVTCTDMTASDAEIMKEHLDGAHILGLLTFANWGLSMALEAIAMQPREPMHACGPGQNDAVGRDTAAACAASLPNPTERLQTDECPALSSNDAQIPSSQPVVRRATRFAVSIVLREVSTIIKENNDRGREYGQEQEQAPRCVFSFTMHCGKLHAYVDRQAAIAALLATLQGRPLQCTSSQDCEGNSTFRFMTMGKAHQQAQPETGAEATARSQTCADQAGAGLDKNASDSNQARPDVSAAPYGQLSANESSHRRLGKHLHLMQQARGQEELDEEQEEQLFGDIPKARRQAIVRTLTELSQGEDEAASMQTCQEHLPLHHHNHQQQQQQHERSNQGLQHGKREPSGAYQAAKAKRAKKQAKSSSKQTTRSKSTADLEASKQAEAAAAALLLEEDRERQAELQKARKAEAKRAKSQQKRAKLEKASDTAADQGPSGGNSHSWGIMQVYDLPE